MINHAEAQSLISARLDEPLDPIVARELDAHLATCPQCRAFANQTAAMTRALQGMPYLPASPRVRRAVFDATQKPVTPAARLQGFFTPVPGSALSTVAAVLVVGLLSLFVITRLLGNQDGGEQQTTLLAPSVEMTRQSDVAQELPTATVPEKAIPAVTATSAAPTQEAPAPTELAPTEPAPTVPAPTETAIPTEPQQQPTETVPAATVPPTAAPTSQSAQTDTSNAIRIGAGNPSPSAAATTPTSDTPTDVPTATEPPVQEPSATLAPTEEPSATETPTEEPVATDTPTEQPAPTETPITPTVPALTPTSSSPMIESTTGTYEPANPGDEPSGTDITAAGTPGNEPSAPTPGSGQAIEPASTQPGANSAPTIGPVVETPGQGQTIPNDGTGGVSTIPEGTADVIGQGAESDPGTVLGSADPSTRIMASGGSWGPQDLPLAPQTSADGTTVSTDAQGRIELCGSDGMCQPMSLPGDGGSRAGVTPIGWIGAKLVVERQTGDGQAEYLAGTVGSATGAFTSLGFGAASTGTAYLFGDALLIETADGWFTASGSSGVGVVTQPPVSDRQQLRLYPDRARVAYVSGGEILIENVYNGYIVGKIPASGIDFDISASDQVVISTGSSIEIWDLSGNRIATYTPPSGDGIGSVAWSGDSILYVDTATGEVRSIAPSDFGPVR